MWCNNCEVYTKNKFIIRLESSEKICQIQIGAKIVALNFPPAILTDDNFGSIFKGGGILGLGIIYRR